MIKPHAFDRATQLVEMSTGHWAGSTSPDYGNMVGAFGGVVNGVLLNAVLSDARAMGDPVSLTVNFCAPVAEGEFTIRTVLQRGGKHTQHWSLELHQNDAVCATSSVVMGRRSDVFSHQPEGLPAVPTYEDSAVMTGFAPVAWINRYEFRYIDGAPELSGTAHAEPVSPRSRLWLRDAPARALDYLSLAAMSDSFLLRLLHVRGTLEPMGTVSLTTHFLATADDMAAQGEQPLLGVADSTRFHGNFHDQQVQLWSPGGKVMATGSQIVWYRQ